MGIAEAVRQFAETPHLPLYWSPGDLQIALQLKVLAETVLAEHQASASCLHVGTKPACACVG